MKYTIVFYMGLSVYSFVYAKSSVDFQNTNHLSLSQMQQKIREQDERIDGLSSVIEGLSATLHKLETRECSTVVSAVSKTDDTLLQKLAKMIDDIHADYVSKDELSRVLSMKEKKPLPAPVKIKKRLDAKKSKVLYSEGVRYFVKQRYNEAKKRFLLTESQNYKPAASNYYLGEISYYTKQYEDAIFYFKKSAGLYDKATYIDTLILHTAISLDKTGQKKQAKVFYKNIIENYKGKKTAKIATDRLRKL